MTESVKLVGPLPQYNHERQRENSEKAFQATQQHLKTLRQQLFGIAAMMHQASDLNTLLENTVIQIQEICYCDRALIYRFNSPHQGTVLAEAKTAGWTPTLAETIPAISFGLEQSQDYLMQQVMVIDIVNQARLTPYQRQLLEKFQIKASLAVPILVETKTLPSQTTPPTSTGGTPSQIEVWGLLVVNHCSSPRQWQESEIFSLYHIATELSQSLERFEFYTQLQQQRHREKSVAKVIDKIRQSVDIDNIFKTTTQEVRQLLQADRIAVYRFNSDWNGEFVAESVASGWTQLVGPGIKTIWEDTYLQESQGGRYRYHEVLAVDNIYEAGHSSCHIEILEQFEVKAYVVAPVFSGKKLWGLLAAYQNLGPRHWQASEVNWLAQIGVQFGIAILQAEYLKQVQTQSQELVRMAERQGNLISLTQKLGEAIITKVPEYQETEAILKTTTQEVRLLLQVDRVTIYCCHPDGKGEFTAESYAKGWTSIMAETIPDSLLWRQEKEQYQKQENFAVADIYTSQFSATTIQLLEQMEAKAYLTVPIWKEQKLWGLLTVYQNTQPRHWEEFEINILNQISALVGVAVQQIDYLRQLQNQSSQLAAAAQREKSAKELLQQRAVQLLAAVRPALDGNLTVRAPVTEDALGTIADAYNNTLQSLRQIVVKVQTAVQQVAQTCSISDTSLTHLNGLAERQSQETSRMLEQIQQTVHSIQEVMHNAQLVEMTVQQATQTIESGDVAMNRTVEAIQEIRETVAQTGKKIKKLSESSQKISKVVTLISDFAKQTNVLALNAAIEATRAGEYGKGFALVADEVRSLSRQSATATTEIEKLVQEIKTETQEVTIAMDLGIQQVVAGTNSVNETRDKLNEIIAATTQISELVEGITQATQVQTQQSVSMAAAMTNVDQIAQTTAEDSSQIAASFKELLVMAQELLVSVEKFKTN